MILTCPACSSRYLIDPAALGRTGRTVRCASCSHRWFARPPDDAPRSAVAEPVDEGERRQERAPPVAHPARLAAATAEVPARSGRLIGWLALALVALAVVGALVGRNEVVAAFPGCRPQWRLANDHRLQLRVQPWTCRGRGAPHSLFPPPHGGKPSRSL